MKGVDTKTVKEVRISNKQKKVESKRKEISASEILDGVDELISSARSGKKIVDHKGRTIIVVSKGLENRLISRLPREVFIKLLKAKAITKSPMTGSWIVVKKNLPKGYFAFSEDGLKLLVGMGREVKVKSW